MSWLFFQDESGHDHKSMPLEVRGGVALHSSKIWEFVRSMQEAEEACFGVRLSDYGSELKGSKLLELKRVQWASQETTLSDTERRNGVKRFLTKSKQGNSPSAREFTAYGQASRLMVSRVFKVLKAQGAVLFASAIPRGAVQPKGYEYAHYLRRDQIYLQQRFFWFLEAKQECGLMVLDQTEKQSDQRYIRRLQDYYTKTSNGKKRSKWVVPYPLFVDSELSLGAQAADLCLFCINWGFRRPEWKFTGPLREDIQKDYAGLCGDLQFNGQSVENGKQQRLFGIIYVPDPYATVARYK